MESGVVNVPAWDSEEVTDMILQALNAFYRRKQTDPAPKNRLPSFGLEDKEIPFVLEIDVEGRLVNLTDTRSGDGKKKIGQRFLVPQGVKKTSGVAANLLWDNAEYVLGVDTRGKPERVVEQHAAYRARLESLPETARLDAGIRAVLAFLDTPELARLESHPAWPDILAVNPVMTFRLHGDLELVCQRPAVIAASEPVATVASETDQPVGICLVSGDSTAIERLHPAIKGVWGAQTSGANIVSFNARAFESYGKRERQGENAPVGKAAVFAYTTALNHLLARDSSQRMQVGDTSTVFWAEEKHELEMLFGEVIDPGPDQGTGALNALYSAVKSGKFAVGNAEHPLPCARSCPQCRAHFAIRFWETATAMELATRIQRHFEDIRIVHADYEPEHLSLFRFAHRACGRRKSDGVI
jgi:CRISPR-associated protein Csd1